MTARSTSRSRASCCCPCDLAPVVTVAAGTRWGDASPYYASHHMMMLVLLYGLLQRPRQAKVYRLLAVYDFRPNTKTKINRTSGQTDKRSVFFFLHVAIRNSLRSNNSTAVPPPTPTLQATRIRARCMNHRYRPSLWSCLGLLVSAGGTRPSTPLLWTEKKSYR